LLDFQTKYSVAFVLHCVLKNFFFSLRILLCAVAFAAAAPEASAADSFCQRSVDRDPRDDWSYAFGKLSGHFEWVNLEPLKTAP
jgi:hypothetical protein